MSWQEVKDDPTPDLIEYIQWRGQPEYKTLSEDAFIAFCFRFRDDVQKKCRVICRNRGLDNTVADEIAEKTFARFLKYPKYSAAKCKSGDTDTCVKLYLYKFASRVLSDYIKSETDGPNPFTGEEEIIDDFPDIEAMPVPPEKKALLEKHYGIIKAALERLSDKHKIIYLTYKQYEDELNEGFYLPRPFLKRLQDRLGLSQASIRVYKKEAFDKIEEYLNIYGKR